MWPFPFRRLVTQTSGFILICWLCLLAGKAEQRIWMNASINGRPARLFLDTGASTTILFAKGATRLGLAFPPLPTTPPHHSSEGMFLTRTEEYDFVLMGRAFRQSFLVAHAPDIPDLTEDGLVGWQTVSRDILDIDAGQEKATRLSNLPRETTTWTRFRVQTNYSPCLDLEAPLPANMNSIVRIDSGSGTGIRLSPRKWREWSARQPARSRTFTEYFIANGRLIVSEEAWADEFSFGDLLLNAVPVGEAFHSEIPPGATNYEATLGLMALRRMDLIVDGKQGIAFVRPKKTPSPVYAHNGLGAIFVPPDLLHPQTGKLAARVLEGSPAYEAGIRNGDILLKVGDTDLTKGRVDQIRLLEQFTWPTNGTKLVLTLQRGTKSFDTTPVLRQILKPSNN